MLSQQEARERLAPFQFHGDAEDRFANELAGLPSSLRARALECVASQDTIDQETRTSLLLQLNDDERAQLVSAIFPQIAAGVARTWDHFVGLPSHLFAQSIFRTRHCEPATRQRQASWLRSLIDIAGEYRPEAMTGEWLSVWAPYLPDGMGGLTQFLNVTFGLRKQDVIGRLLAGVIDTDEPASDNVFDTLKLIVEGRHPSSALSGHVLLGLSRCNRAEAFDLLFDLLENAADETLTTHIMQAFTETSADNMVQLLDRLQTSDLLENPGLRTTLALWACLSPEEFDQGVALQWLDLIVPMFKTSIDRSIALESGDALQTRFALWTEGVLEIETAVAVADGLLEQSDEETRLAITQTLAAFHSPQCIPVWRRLLLDDSPTVSGRTLFWSELTHSNVRPEDADAVIEVMQEVYERSDGKSATELGIHPLKTSHFYEQFFLVLSKYWACAKPERPIGPLLVYLKQNKDIRCLSEMIASATETTVADRTAMLALCNDETHGAHALLRCYLQQASTTDELLAAARIQGLHFQSTFREQAFKSPDASLMDLISALLAARKESQRAIGLHLLGDCLKQRRNAKVCSHLVQTFASRSKLTKKERRQVSYLKRHIPREFIESAEALPDGYPTAAQTPTSTAATNTAANRDWQQPQRSPVTRPQSRNVVLNTEAAVGCLRSLEQFIIQHADSMVESLHPHRRAPDTADSKDDPVATLQYQAWHWNFHREDRQDPDQPWPVESFWLTWHAQRSEDLKDADGLELQRARLMLQANLDISIVEGQVSDAAVLGKLHACSLHNFDGSTLHTKDAIAACLCFLTRDNQIETANLTLDALEDFWASCLPNAASLSNSDCHSNQFDLRRSRPAITWNHLLKEHFFASHQSMPGEFWQRWWGLLRWSEHPSPDSTSWWPTSRLLVKAFALGYATTGDLLFALRHGHAIETELLIELKQVASDRFAEWQTALGQFGYTLVSAEVARKGSTPTVTTQEAMSCNFLPGLELLVPLLQKAGKQGFKRVTDNINNARVVRSHLASIIFPTDTDSIQAFAQTVGPLVQSKQVARATILQLGLLAPQWADHIEHCLGLVGYCDAVIFWLRELPHPAIERRCIYRRLGEPTLPWLPEDEFGKLQSNTGKPFQVHDVDVDWLKQLHASLGADAWLELASAFKAVTKPTEHQRVCNLVAALNDQLNIDEQIELVKEAKPKADSRLLGIIPLPVSQPQRGEDLSQRLSAIEVYRRAANSQMFGDTGHMLPEANTARELLAQQLDLASVDRLELHTLATLSQPIDELQQLKFPEGLLRTSFDVTGNLILSVEQNGKVRRTVSAALKKHMQVAALVETRKQIKRQATLVRQALERAMRSDAMFSVAELRGFVRHGSLGAMLRSLAFVTTDGFMGYLDSNANVLSSPVQANPLTESLDKPSPTLRTRKLQADESIRLLHPSDLYRANEWKAWRDEFSKSKRTQCIPQVQRELFVVRPHELESNSTVDRFADQQLDDVRTQRILEAMGWQFGRFDARIVYPQSRVVGIVDFEFIGRGIQFGGLRFYPHPPSNKLEVAPTPLSKISPRLFSETTRDLHQVIQVAELSTEDETTASEDLILNRQAIAVKMMEAGLLPNTLRTGSLLRISGQLSDYTLDLVTATAICSGRPLTLDSLDLSTVHKLPSSLQDDDPDGFLLLAAAQQLARDFEIQNPVIRDQILAR